MPALHLRHTKLEVAMRKHEAKSAGMSEKIKNWLDWLGRSYVLVEVFISLGLASAVRAVLIELEHIPPAWITPIWLICAGLILWLMVVLTGERIAIGVGQIPSSEIQAAASGTLAPADGEFDVDKFFEQSYNSPLANDVDKAFRQTLQKYELPEDRENLLLRFISSGFVGYLHDMTWASIYKSQITLLQRLNQGLLQLDDVKRFYNEASRESPKTYANYSFSQWLDWMMNQRLITQEGTTFGITLRGRDFLKYMVHYGLSPANKLL